MTQKVAGACVPIEYLVLGIIDNNVYLVGDDAACFVVDPSCHARQIAAAVEGRTVQGIIVTHAHWDHFGAAADLREQLGVPVYASAVDAPYVSSAKGFDGMPGKSKPCPVDHLLQDGDTLELGGASWKVIATPGHTPGGICLFAEGAAPGQGAPVLISGDTLFRGAHGRVDFPGSDPAAMMRSLRRLAQLPGETIVLPGHNGLTTIARERAWMPR